MVLTFLESVGRRSEAEFYLKLFRGLPRESFAMIAPGSPVIRHTLGSLVEQLQFLAELGLYTPLVLGLTNPASAAQSAEKLVRKLPGAGLTAKAFSFAEPSLADRIREELARDVTPVLYFEGTPETSVIERMARLGELANALDTRKLVMLRRTGGLGPRDGGKLVLGEGHVLGLGSGGISVINLRTDLEAVLSSKRLRKEESAVLESVAGLFSHVGSTRLLVSVTSPFGLMKELFTVKGAGTLVKPGTPIERHGTYAGLDVAAIRTLIETSFAKGLVPGFFDASPLDVYIDPSYRGAAILHASPHGAYLSKLVVDPVAQGEGIGQDLWQAMTRDHRALFWRARPGNSIISWYASLADGLIRLPEWQIFWHGISPDKVPGVVEESLAKPNDFV
jgi:bifunctional N-acetylglutamate synthase/kinase